MEIRNMLAARGRSHKDGFPTVGAVCDRPHFVNSRKNTRSQTAPTIDPANSADFCHGLLEYADAFFDGFRPEGVAFAETGTEFVFRKRKNICGVGSAIL